MIRCYKTEEIEKTGFGDLPVYTSDSLAPKRPKWSYPGDYMFTEEFTFDGERPAGKWVWIKATNWKAMVYVSTREVSYSTLIGGFEILNLAAP